MIWFYEKGRKLSVIPKISAEALAQFAAEEAIRTEATGVKERNSETDK